MSGYEMSPQELCALGADQLTDIVLAERAQNKKLWEDIRELQKQVVRLELRCEASECQLEKIKGMCGERPTPHHFDRDIGHDIEE